MNDSEKRERLANLYLQAVSRDAPEAWEAERREDWREVCADSGLPLNTPMPEDKLADDL